MAIFLSFVVDARPERERRVKTKICWWYRDGMTMKCVRSEREIYCVEKEEEAGSSKCIDLANLQTGSKKASGRLQKIY